MSSKQTFQALNKKLVFYLLEQNKVLDSNVKSILNITDVEKGMFDFRILMNH